MNLKLDFFCSFFYFSYKLIALINTQRTLNKPPSWMSIWKLFGQLRVTRFCLSTFRSMSHIYINRQRTNTESASEQVNKDRKRITKIDWIHISNGSNRRTMECVVEVSLQKKKYTWTWALACRSYVACTSEQMNGSVGWMVGSIGLAKHPIFCVNELSTDTSYWIYKNAHTQPPNTNYKMYYEKLKTQPLSYKILSVWFHHHSV